MDKLTFESPDLTAGNVEKIGALFPNCVTEAMGEDGKLKKAINFDLLRQMLSDEVVEGDEAYEFTWVGKKAAIVEANRPIRKTLRPCPEESVDWDATENLYIEGDNLEVLKLLQESYLGKIKMIYIDPPYNTGNDFIYRDDFSVGADDYDEQAGVYDDAGDRLFKNTDSNGRFHSDWCSMLYSRLLVARNLLANDGAIFVSIDENEIDSLLKIMDDVFGRLNRIGVIVIRSNPRGSMAAGEIANLHEYLVLYGKNVLKSSVIGHELTSDMQAEYKYQDESGNYRLLGLRMRGGFWRRNERPNLYFPIFINPKDGTVSLSEDESHYEIALPIQPSTLEDGTWRWSKEKIRAKSNLLVGKLIKRGDEEVWDVYQKDYYSREGGRRTKAKSIWEESEINYQNGTTEIKQLFGNSGIFDYAKPVFLIHRIIEMVELGDDAIILDFFSGSATTAHALMQFNAEDGGHRKFIMVQLPEKCNEQSEAYKAGYHNICEIGKERIRRVGSKLRKALEEDGGNYRHVAKAVELGIQKTLFDDDGKVIATVPDIPVRVSKMDETEDNKALARQLDIGFRVFKLDEVNTEDVFYSAEEYSQGMLAGMESNIKPDRTDLDLLFGCLLEWGLPLSLPYTSETIEGCAVHTYNGGDLIACFNEDVPESVIKEIARRRPLRAVFRDSSFPTSPAKINVEEIFKMLAPDTRVKVI